MAAPAGATARDGKGFAARQISLPQVAALYKKQTVKPRSPHRRRSRLVVLIADDDADARDIYGRYLTVMGCRVFTARDGLSAVAAARRSRPDVVVMDLAMPRLNGWDAIVRLKRAPATRAIPIVALSAVPTSRGHARDAGCDGFLAKPCLPEMLWCEIRLLLGSTRVGA